MELLFLELPEKNTAVGWIVDSYQVISLFLECPDLRFAAVRWFFHGDLPCKQSPTKISPSKYLPK